MGEHTIFAKEYFDHEPAGRRLLLGRIATLIFSSGAFIALAFLLIDSAGGFLSQLLKMGRELILLAIGAAALNALVALTTTLLQVEKRAVSYAIFVNGKTLLEAAVSLSLIILCGWSWAGRIGGIAVSSLVFGMLSLFFFKRLGAEFKLPVRDARRLILLGLPLIAAHVSVWIYGMVDRVMINNLFSLEATGIYSVGFRFGTVVAMVDTACSIAWMPFFYENIRSTSIEVNERLVRLTYYYVLGLFLFASAFGLSTHWLIPAMVDRRFATARQFALLICIAFWFSGVWKIFGIYLIAKGKNKLYGCISSGVALMHIGLTYFLLIRMGVVGAAWATMFTYAIATCVTIAYAVNLHPMPWGCIWRRRMEPIPVA